MKKLYGIFGPNLTLYVTEPKSFKQLPPGNAYLKSVRRQKNLKGTNHESGASCVPAFFPQVGLPIVFRVPLTLSTSSILIALFMN
ncbi:hypothetical protein BpHYR1_030888 [Brachionus plicatilis]|uniref:Uncharacterized protein n=1 Tax=Brachionus plicatilis TaxID=10195 RepID=A0A3M7RGB9_BRAPC|nr:hypothetical protein BpHYR1_030888 [Brachionus plicatilis]